MIAPPQEDAMVHNESAAIIALWCMVPEESYFARNIQATVDRVTRTSEPLF